MLSRLCISLVFAILFSLLFAVPAFAGGWAVITLDELPSDVVAGEPLTVGFTVLQHGRTPMTGLSPTITANLFKEDEIVVTAEPEGKPGHYTATLTFPKEGDWQWSIQAFSMDQAMPALSVSAPKAAATNPPVLKPGPGTSPLSPMILVSVALLALGVVSAVIGLRRRSRLVMGLTAVFFLAGLTLLITGASTASAVEAQSKSEPEIAENPSISQVELGRQLFIAKGCITCHYNSKAGSPSEYWTIEMGAPNLSKFSAAPEILFIRLKDPAAAKSDTKMPNLDLTEDEIEALIAFINSK